MGILSHRSAVGRVYLALVPWAGAAVLGWSLVDLALRPADPSWLALATLTVLTGSFTVKIPGLVARLSVSEPFVFAATLWFGPSVGAVTAALDALIMSLWLLPGLKTLHRLAFNVSVLVISIWLSSQIFFLLSGIDPRAPVYGPLSNFVVPLYLFTACCFLLNSGMIAAALSIERGQSGLRIWRQQFLWLSLNYFGGASVAALLVVYARQIDWPVIGIIVPLLAISYLTFRTTLGRLDDANAHLTQLNRLYLSTIETLAMAVDAKDQVTHGHIRRVQRYALGLASALGATSHKQLKAMEAAALLHDMGKLAVPEYILNKPGHLTKGEFAKMKLHASIGADILSAIDFPYPVVPIVRHHHENWDGSGYPDELKGTDIPLGARILSVVDCYDALTSDRPYREKLSTEQALEIILKRRGSMYDPIVVDKFIEHLNDLDASVANIDPASETLKRIAELSAAPPPQVIPDPSARIRLGFSDTLGVQTTSTDLAKLALGYLAGIVPIDGCIVYRVQAGSTDLCAVSVSGMVPTVYLGSTVGIGERVVGWVGATAISALNSSAGLDLADNVAGTGGLLSGLVCSVQVGDRLIGVLAIYSKVRGAFSAADQLAVESLARCFVSALETTEESSQLDQGMKVNRRKMTAMTGTAFDGWFPLGIVALQSEKQQHRDVLRILGSSVREVDSVFEVETGSSLVLIRATSHASTKQVVERLRSACADRGLGIELAWAIVGEVDAGRQIAPAVDESPDRDWISGTGKPH